MSETEFKATLILYLQRAREVMLWKLDGLTEYDARRPLTPTGTNLLGLVKHLASVEFGYFGQTFGRPYEGTLPWFDEGALPNADMWVTPEESREYIVDLYQTAWAHAQLTFDQLDLDAKGRVPWWPPERAEVTLHQILVHMTTETHRHAGHADIGRELIDGSVGLRVDALNLSHEDEAARRKYVERLEAAAQQAKN